MNQDDLIKLYLHKPDNLAANYVEWAEWIKDAPKIDYGCILDRHVIPLHPGDLMAVVARPGHGKSSFMAYMAKRTATKLVERNETKKCVIYISFEQSAEEVEAFFQSGDKYNSTDLAWGRVSVDAIRAQSVKRAGLPIWTIGYSIKDAGINKPPMTLDVVYEAIKRMKYEYGYEPVLICLDYLQVVPVKGNSSKAEKVAQATSDTKQLAQSLGVPIISGVQAGRDADDRISKIPTMSDAQWSSAIEQTADKQISLMRPIKAEVQVVEVNGIEYTVDDDLMVIRLLKQRFDIGSGTWCIKFKPQTLEIADYITRL